MNYWQYHFTQKIAPIPIFQCNSVLAMCFVLNNAISTQLFLSLRKIMSMLNNVCSKCSVYSSFCISWQLFSIIFIDSDSWWWANWHTFKYENMQIMSLTNTSRFVFGLKLLKKFRVRFVNCRMGWIPIHTKIPAFTQIHKIDNYSFESLNIF